MHKIWLMWYISHKYRAQVIPTIYKCYQIFFNKITDMIEKDKHFNSAFDTA